MITDQKRRSAGLRRTSAVSAAVACMAVAMGIVLPGLASAAEPWEIKSFAAHTTDEAAAEYNAAGGHAFQNSTAFEFTSHPEAGGGTYPNEQLKDSSVALEPGFIGNPAVAPRCPIPDIQDPLLNTLSKTFCPPGSRIGTAYATIIGGPVKASSDRSTTWSPNAASRPSSHSESAAQLLSSRWYRCPARVLRPDDRLP